MFGSSGNCSLGFLFMSSFTCAKTFLRESGGIIKGLTCLLDKTLRYSYGAFMFCSNITHRVNLAKIILMSLIIATGYFTNLTSLSATIRVLLTSAILTCKLVIAYLLQDTCPEVIFK